ncbi:hypothetical protein FJ250_11730, partial [bacterium]|nr:hypothetical protein [bacterium]
MRRHARAHGLQRVRAGAVAGAADAVEGAREGQVERRCRQRRHRSRAGGGARVGGSQHDLQPRHRLARVPGTGGVAQLPGQVLAAQQQPAAVLQIVGQRGPVGVIQPGRHARRVPDDRVEVRQFQRRQRAGLVARPVGPGDVAGHERRRVVTLERLAAVAIDQQHLHARGHDPERPRHRQRRGTLADDGHVGYPGAVGRQRRQVHVDRRFLSGLQRDVQLRHPGRITDQPLAQRAGPGGRQVLDHRQRVRVGRAAGVGDRGLESGQHGQVGHRALVFRCEGERQRGRGRGGRRQDQQRQQQEGSLHRRSPSSRSERLRAKRGTMTPPARPPGAVHGRRMPLTRRHLNTLPAVGHDKKPNRLHQPAAPAHRRVPVITANQNQIHHISLHIDIFVLNRCVARTGYNCSNSRLLVLSSQNRRVLSLRGSGARRPGPDGGVPRHAAHVRAPRAVRPAGHRVPRGVPNMLRRRLLSLMLALLALSAVGAGATTIKLGEEPSALAVTAEKGTGLSFHVQVGELQAIDIATKSGVFTRLAIPGFHTSMQVGAPELPQMNRLVSVPAGATARVSYRNVQKTRVRLADHGITHPLFPAQESVSKSADLDNLPFVQDMAIYMQKTVSRETATILAQGRLRAMDIARLEIAPVTWFPAENEIEVITSMDVDVAFDNVDQAYVTDLIARTYSPFFEHLYAGMAGSKAFHDAYPDRVKDLVTMVK